MQGIVIKWVINTIEIVGIDEGDVLDSRKTQVHKQHRSVALMACVLEACYLETYVDAHDKPKWENAIIEE